MFILFLFVILFFVVLKTGHIFDFGIIFRKFLVPQATTNRLLNPPYNLSDDYQKLLVENSGLKALVQENEQLKNLLQFQRGQGRKLVVANVSTRDSVNPNIININVGSRSGLAIGQPVVVNNGIIIGRIIELADDSARVRLLTDKFSKLAVRVGDTESITGLLTGTLGIGMTMSYIPQDRELKKGDLVLTAETDTQVPSGLIVGTVEKVDFSQEELFKKASVTPLLDYNSLSIVAVLI